MMNNDDILILENDHPDIALTREESEKSGKILLVDDEIQVHQVFKLVLRDFSFEGKSLTFLDAYSGQEAEELIAANPDTAVVFLDVVMETDDAGLRVVKYIRETLHNDLVRIILLTGQSGEYPEDAVIIDYDINDYQAKVELEAKRLVTTMIAALRSFRDAKALADSRQQLVKLKGQLQDVNNLLEEQVKQQTDTLIQTNQQLLEEIQDHQQTDEELLVTNSCLNAVVQNSSTVIIILSCDYRIQEWNEEAEKVYGWSRELVLGEDYLLLFVPPNLRENLKLILAEVVRKKNIRNIETQIIARNGEEKCLLSNFTVLSDAQQKKPAVILCGQDITQRQKIEASLQEGEERLRATFEQAAVGIAHVAPSGHWLRVNQKLCQIVGYAQEELLNLTFQDITHPDDLEIELEYVQQMLGNEIATYSLEKRYIRQDGSIVWINLTVSLVWTSTKIPKYFISVIEDISQRKKIEKTLQESERSYRRIIDTAQEGIWLIDPERNISFVNPKMSEMLGYSPEEMLGKHLFEFMDTEGQKNAEMKLERCRQGIKENQEFVFRRQDNSFIHTLISTNPVLDEQGKYLGTLAMVADITERKQAEEALKASERRYATLTEISPVGIFRADLEGSCLYVNKKWLQIAQISQEEALGNGWAKAIYSDDREKVMKSWSDAVKSNSPFATEYRFQTPEGKIVWVFGQATPERNEQGEIIGYVGTVTDITERKQAEEKIQALAKRLLTIIETVGEGITLSDFQGNFVVFNHPMEEITGYSPIEAQQSDNFLALLYPEPEMRQKAQQRIRETIELGKRQNQETIIRAKDGTSKTLLVSSSLVRVGKENLLLTAYRDITDWKTAQEKLQLSETRLQTIFSSTSDAIMILDQQGIVHFANPAASKLFGKPLEKLIGYEMGIPMLVNQTTELTIPRHQGELVIGEMSLSQTRWDKESVYVVSLRDITARKQMERELQETKDRLNSILNSLEDVVWSVSLPTYEFVYINPAMEKVYQRKMQEFFENPQLWLEVVHPEDYVSVANSQKILLETSRKDLEYRIILPSGETRWLRDRSWLVNDQDGKPIRFDGIATDITEQKLSQEALEASENKYRLLVEHLSDGIYLIDANFQPIYFNQAIKKILGNSEKQFAENFFNFIHADDRNNLIKSINYLQQSWLENNYRIITPEGDIRYLRDRMQLIRDQQGKVEAYQGIISDLTAIKETELALTAAKEAADAANRAKSEFLANMSHEIRTPMNAILGFCDLLQGMITEPRQLGYLQSIASGSKTLLTLINDILDLSKIEAGRLALNYEPVDLRLLIADIQQIFAPKASKKHILLLTEIEESLPPAISFDEVRLRQILFNVVGNALKFTDQGYIKIRVQAQFLTNLTNNQEITTTQTITKKISLEIAVEDTGIGIAPQDQGRIFNVFMQSEGQSTRKYGGTGLGLTITKRLTEMLGGRIELESEPNQGSTFKLIFPQVTVADLGVKKQTQITCDLSLNDFEPMTVLVVDDVKSNRDLIRGYFTETEHCLLMAKDGVEGLKMAHQYHPDLILLDLKMPNLNGEEVAKCLKEDSDTKDIPIIIVTASAIQEDREKFDHLCQAFLFKPVSYDQLVYELDNIFPRKESLRNPKSEKQLFPANKWEITPESLAKLPELLEKLRQEEENRGKILYKTMKTRDLRQFAQNLQSLAIEYQCTPLLDYANTLETQIQELDLEQLPKTIENFAKLRQYLETFSDN